MFDSMGRTWKIVVVLAYSAIHYIQGLESILKEKTVEFCSFHVFPLFMDSQI